MNLKHFNLKHIKLDKIESTNSYLHTLKTSRNNDLGTIVSAENQTLGKGQKGNLWQTEANKNLTFSVITYPNINVKYAFYLNIISSIAVQKALSDLKIESLIKWPNDILVNKKKICGILVENQINGNLITQSIIGIGLNVNQTNFESNLNATSIKKQGIDIDIEDLLLQIYGYLDFYYNLMIQSNFKLLLTHYYSHLFWYNQIGTFKDNNSEFNALLLGINEIGRLELKLLDHTKRSFDLKEISFIY